MSYFRQTWPSQTVTPKPHMLEDHVIDFVRKEGLGVGVYGEQGGESIHEEFNNLKTQYWHLVVGNGWKVCCENIIYEYIP